MASKVVGLGNAPPQSKKAQAAARRLASQPAMNPHRGQDPTVTTVDKPKAVEDEVSGKPDRSSYDKEQEALKAQIEVLQAKQNEVKAKISATSGKGANQDRKVALRAELDSLRAEQAKIKGGRGKTLDQVKTLQDNLAKKIKDVQAAKGKLQYKTAAEVDGQIKNLERQVESGTMKLVDEKKALAEISQLKKTRKTVESFGPLQDSIDADKAKIDEIRATLDDPAVKSVSDKFNAARAELDQINKQHDELSKGRDALFDERNAIGKEIDALYTQKKASVAAFREANDKYYDKINAQRTARLERQRAERQQYEDTKRAEINERLLEEAQAPAFEREIEDCQTLIDFFRRRTGQAGSAQASNGSSLYTRPDVKGVAKLELRQIDAAPPPGGVALKKKGEQEEEVWGGGAKNKKKQQGNKKGAVAAPVAEEKEAKDPNEEKLNLPFGTLGGLLALGISSPLTVGEVPKTIEALEAKKAYFKANQERVTKEKVDAVNKKIRALELKTNGKEESSPASATPAADSPALEAEEKAEETPATET